MLKHKQYTSVEEIETDAIRRILKKNPTAIVAFAKGAGCALLLSLFILMILTSVMDFKVELLLIPIVCISVGGVLWIVLRYFRLMDKMRNFGQTRIFCKFVSLEALADTVNEIKSTIIYKDSNVIIGEDGFMPRKLPDDAETQYDGLTLFDDVLALSLLECYENELVSGTSLGYFSSCNLRMGYTTGSQANLISLSSNKPVLTGYRVVWYDKWGDEYELWYPIEYKKSAEEVYKTLSKKCKRARKGVFDGMEEYILEKQGDLPDPHINFSEAEWRIFWSEIYNLDFTDIFILVTSVVGMPIFLLLIYFTRS